MVMELEFLDDPEGTFLFIGDVQLSLSDSFLCIHTKDNNGQPERRMFPLKYVKRLVWKRGRNDNDDDEEQSGADDVICMWNINAEKVVNPLPTESLLYGTLVQP